MEKTGVFTNLDGRQVTVDMDTFFLRKSALENTTDYEVIQSLVGKKVSVTSVEEKGFNMVQEIKPEIPATAVEKTPAQPLMAASQTMTVANDAAKGVEFTQKPGNNRSQKDMDITYSWSFNCATSDVWANCNDSLVLSTEQMKHRIRDLAAWYRNELLSR